MKLIGAGLPRTATLTQKVALEMLGLVPCHHMVEVFADLSQAARWRAVLDGELAASEVLADHPAMVDWPGSYHYAELMEAFPDAKVLLSVRPAEQWARSIRGTIWECMYGDGLLGHMSQARERVDDAWGDWIATLREMWARRGLINGKETTDAFMAEAMERYNDEVEATVPADRLLVWSPGDGWGPLCDFLELPVPEEPLPHVNDTETFGQLVVDGALAALTTYRAGAVPA